MSGSDNPYNASFGNQMTATTSFSATPEPAAAAGSYITETTTANFGTDVIEESRKQPVLVDFWAPWCGPCKQLTPVLEKVINEAKGRVRLVKMNIDDHPSIAGQLGIQSIPAVIAFVNGRPADGFMGAVPESQIQQFIDRIAGPAGADEAAEIEAVLAEAAELLAAGNINEAAQLYGAVMQADPENAKALAGMAECMIAADQHQRAREILTELPEELAKDAGIQAVLMKLEHIEEARKLGDPVALERELAANPDDHEARIKLAKIRNVEGRRDEAADHLLLIMRKDRAFDDDGARRQLLQFFEVWGFKDPATVAARRKLSAMLFS
ncbi:thioredoxin [Rhizobium ruizarguesonis]|jgi:putative thioredoxin|uniref:Thioredoxin n=1 Tax=Rhizobium ruizarguesonis TaxID=2081791 RepID=A0AB38I9V3_9HYPH|nr:thioredoxin [Rhizobium ruizarguesonis]NEI04591.1 thioredoxin [Rhizobium ruizarguesonis]NEI27386.1 thioredoxin [Rhizobium ruizarguesonis]TAY96130.1 thioredoxin [Rhizobium ruizarguesonis]TAZ80512.1 thioredoxin [Rhizobium ruizarguesonis]TBA06897.1 thioredoxin [Rhizobium ruizarguesonis]